MHERGYYTTGERVRMVVVSSLAFFVALNSWVIIILSSPAVVAAEDPYGNLPPLYRVALTGAIQGGLVPGDTFRGSSHTVYYLGDDYRRYPFPSKEVFFSWYADFSKVKVVGDSVLASFPLGGNVTYRPATRLVKFESDPKVYAVDNGAYLRWIPTEALAAELYGPSWNTLVDDIPVSLLLDYFIGPQLSSASEFNSNTILAASPNITVDWKTWKVARKKQIEGTFSDAPHLANESAPVSLQETPVVISPTITLQAIDVSSGSISLRWLSYGIADLQAFLIYRQNANGAIGRTSTGNYIDSGITKNTSYTYWIEARNGRGESIAQSNRITVATPDSGSLSQSQLALIPSSPAPTVQTPTTLTAPTPSLPTIPTTPATPTTPSTNVVGTLVVIDDLNGDGKYTGVDVEMALAACGVDCTVRGLAVTYDDVQVRIPQHISGTLIIEGVGIGQTIFRSKVPQVQPIFRKYYQAKHVTFRNFTLDGRRVEQTSALFKKNGVEQWLTGISVYDWSGLDRGPGLVTNVELKEFVHTGFSTLNGKNWIIENSLVHHIGCAKSMPCPALVESNHPLGSEIQEHSYGIVFVQDNGAGGVARNNTVYNITKLGIEAYGVADNFHFYNNTVSDTLSGGIVANNASYGIIENNTITNSQTHGISCGGVAGNNIYRNNTITGSKYYSMNMQCWGDNSTVVGNTLQNNCQVAPGSSNSLFLGPPQSTSGWVIKDNIVNETNCQFAAFLSGHKNLTLENNRFTGGTNATALIHDSNNVTIKSSILDGKGNAGGILLLYNLDGVTIKSDTVITGSKAEIVNNQPSTIKNVVDER